MLDCVEELADNLSGDPSVDTGLAADPNVIEAVADGGEAEFVAVRVAAVATRRLLRIHSVRAKLCRSEVHNLGLLRQEASWVEDPGSCWDSRLLRIALSHRVAAEALAHREDKVRLDKHSDILLK